MEKVNVFSSDDYAGFEVGDLHFYYGYEVTGLMLKEDEESDDIEDFVIEDEWCFQVKKGDKEIYKLTTTQIEEEVEFSGDEPINYLLAGVAIWIGYSKQVKIKK